MAKAKPWVVCPSCGLRGDERPGFRLVDYPLLEAVIVPINEELDQFAALVGDRLPQKLECRRCGHTEPVAGGSITVEKRGDDG